MENYLIANEIKKIEKKHSLITYNTFNNHQYIMSSIVKYTTEISIASLLFDITSCDDALAKQIVNKCNDNMDNINLNTPMPIKDACEYVKKGLYLCFINTQNIRFIECINKLMNDYSPRNKLTLDEEISGMSGFFVKNNKKSC